MVHYLKDSFFANRTNLQNVVCFVKVSAKIVKYCGVENRLRMGVGPLSECCAVYVNRYSPIMFV
jgi:hypothetical protein